MDGAELLRRLEAAKARLRASGMFDVSEAQEPPLGESGVREVEARIGGRLPEPLRSFWGSAAGLYGFYVDLTDESREDLDVEPSASQIEIVDPAQIRRRERGGRELVRFTNDGSGDGWALDVTGVSPDRANVVWVRHDGDEASALGAKQSSVEALFVDLEGRYFLDGEMAEIVEDHMQAPTRRAPTADEWAAMRAGREAAPASAPGKPASKRTTNDAPASNKPAAKRPAAKPLAKKPVAKPAAKKPSPKNPATKKPSPKKPAAKKPAAKKPASKKKAGKKR